MKIFIDTAVKGCNVVLFDDDQILAMHQEPIERGHAENILPIYQDLLEQTGRKSEEIHAVYVTVGPGSFTGLRVGLTAARFIGFSLGAPVHGITTFQCFSAGCEVSASRAVLIETKRKDFYAQILNENHQALSEAQSLSGEEVRTLLRDSAIKPQDGNVMLTGDAVERFVPEVSKNEFQIFPQEMLDLVKVIAAIRDNKFDLVAANPFYIRDADVSQPKKKVS